MLIFKGGACMVSLHPVSKIHPMFSHNSTLSFKCDHFWLQKTEMAMAEMSNPSLWACPQMRLQVWAEPRMFPTSGSVPDHCWWLTVSYAGTGVLELESNKQSLFQVVIWAFTRALTACSIQDVDKVSTLYHRNGRSSSSPGYPCWRAGCCQLGVFDFHHVWHGHVSTWCYW